VSRRSPLRALLRWISLIATVIVLGALGAKRVHLHNFHLFLAILIGLALLTVTVFVVTARGAVVTARGAAEE